MQIIIDVPNSLYNHITTNIEPNRQADDMLNVLISSIADGTPLPKGHGRLIDADELINATDHCRQPDFRFYVQGLVKEIPTIIPASKDKEQKGELP